MNSSGRTGKLGSGSTRSPSLQNEQSLTFLFVRFVILVWLSETDGTMDKKLSVHRALWHESGGESSSGVESLRRLPGTSLSGSLPISRRRAGNLHCDCGVASNRASSGNFG